MDAAEPSRYPAELEADVVLADGGTARVRPIRPDDAAALRDLHARLSPETIYRRFFSPRRELTDEEVDHLVRVDYRDRLALVVVLEGALVAVARYDRIPGSADAEVAFVVEDRHQGRGIGTILLEHLAAAAVWRGIRRFVADALAENRAMLGVFRSAGFEETQALESGVVRVVLDLVPTREYLERVEERERVAGVRSIERLLRPRSVAVVGASREPGTIGHELFRNLLNGGFAGPVYPVNPKATHVASVRAYPSVLEVPDAVDLAVVAVPAALVPAVVRECGEKGVHGLVVVSAGFAEAGPKGAAAERELARLAHELGMRVVGPNCMGVVNTDPDVSMNATFAPVPPRRGGVAFSSQSGGLGIAILAEAGRRGLGVSSFVSIGNKADVSSNDLLRYWEQDPSTEVILLYLESFGNPRMFSRIARRIARRKPIVAVKGGRTPAGSRGAASHTAAMATPEVAVEALFRQAGVIRVDTLEELFDVAGLLVDQPLPQGCRVAIVGNAGGPGVLAADACESHGLEVPELSPETQARLRSFLPAEAAVGNPVDLVASASAQDYRRALEAVLADERVDAVLVIFTPPLVTQAADVAEALAEVGATASKPLLANFLATDAAIAALRGAARPIPWFAYPEAAARALARVAGHVAWRERPEGAVPELADVDSSRAAALVRDSLGTASSRDALWLAGDLAAELLGAYGIPVIPTRRAADADSAVAAAEEIGYPVVVKAGSPTIVHKSDVGGVVVGVADEAALRAAFADLSARLGDALGGVLVQPVAPAGVELIVGVVQDPAFGPLVLLGAGGTAAELLGDRRVTLVPLTDVDARELVRSLRSSPLLFGYRGSPACDVEALEDMLVRVSRLADDLPEVAELDCNPVVASAAGVVALDVKVRLAPAPLRPPLVVRRLR